MALLRSVGDFPPFDSLHAHCAMKMNFPSTACNDAFSKMLNAVNTWHPEPDTSAGTYALVTETDNSSIWATRTTPVKHYVDDILFQYSSNSNGGCSIAAKSRSQTLSYYDYSTNFCNMWNVFQVVGGSPTMSVSDCTFPADDPKTVCAKY